MHPLVFIHIPFVHEHVNALVVIVIVVVIYVEEKEGVHVSGNFDGCNVARLNPYLLDLCGLNISIY